MYPMQTSVMHPSSALEDLRLCAFMSQLAVSAVLLAGTTSSDSGSTALLHVLPGTGPSQGDWIVSEATTRNSGPLNAVSALGEHEWLKSEPSSKRPTATGTLSASRIVWMFH